MRNLLLLASAALIAGCAQVQSLGGGSGNDQCSSDGDLCAAAADCCSGVCSNGACEAAPSCAPNGDACGVGADCCSQLCMGGTCSSGPQVCAPDGDPCVSYTDCCSQQCSAGVCSSNPMCANDGNACSADADCCSQQCSGGVCSSGPVCAPDGNACSIGADCCSQQCSGGVCSSGPVCAPDGNACSIGADCCSQQCSGGICSSEPVCFPNGDPCLISADCCSQLCSGAVCTGVTVYSTSFEGACPDGWTLTGDWQCGVPMNVGPATAFTGSQCIATQIAGDYHDLQSFAGTTATSPDIDLSNAATPLLTFRMWMNTEGSTYDGVNLQISTDGGVSYALLNAVTPPYSLTIAGQPAWGGHQEALGWQLMQADLSGYAGQIIRVRFAFRTDSSGNFPGVYIDDVLVF